MGDMPEMRVVPGEYPFEHTGSDVYGPVELSCGRTIVKRWVIIFVCMKTRAVFMELLYNLTADEVVQTLNEFQSTRGRPRHIYTDQGTNYVGAHIYQRQLHHLQQERRKRRYDSESNGISIPATRHILEAVGAVSWSS